MPASEIPKVDFDNDGEWNDNVHAGPAVHAPSDIKSIPINGYRIDWLNLSQPGNNLYLKNHMVATLIFTETQHIRGHAHGYMSARISMEMGGAKKIDETVSCEDWEPGVDYCPGTYILQLLRYNTPNRRSVHNRTFYVREGLTIGTFIDKIIELKMHHFVFLPYVSQGRWKGCGDHTIHAWAVFVREGYLLNERSIEEADIPLSDEFTFTYIEGDRRTWERVGRGWWVSYNPVEDYLVPETMFSDRLPSYLLPNDPKSQSLKRLGGG